MIGLGTYSFFWQHSSLVAEPLTLADMLRRTRELDVEVFQICDYPQLLDYSAAEARELRVVADGLGIQLELGTRGVQSDHLASYLSLAETLGATVVRSMINTADHKPSLDEAEGLLRTVLPSFEGAGVTVALETYEQVRSADLVALIEAVASPSLGICLDPANSVAALENPVEVIDRCAPYVANIHSKDFAFTRRGGWVGFTLEGVPLGTGLLDYDYLLEKVRPDERGINQIIEHWLPLGETIEDTIRLENSWNTSNLQYLRSK
ncbi:sugar phosphate isomerase/epimerase [Glaciihabitans tibetensis]|uniref:Sugar phosphate isomerase/epimerase n=1 Tax=Glaciihabitans tibetensis TaxID=1266600 RepID=A0A2T0V9W4_9MICO|nr:TIM barrel protein [Glaciihabitans tibetensis]PRY66943.1 sugar phosphate isomerase/epimerase [Glaciihabitans tibetensis]